MTFSTQLLWFFFSSSFLVLFFLFSLLVFFYHLHTYLWDIVRPRLTSCFNSCSSSCVVFQEPFCGCCVFCEASFWQVYNILFDTEMRQFHVVICLLDNLTTLSLSLSPFFNIPPSFLCINVLVACCIMLFMFWFPSEESEKVNIAAARCLSVWNERNRRGRERI